MDDGDFASTYKYALLLALADLSIEAPADDLSQLVISTDDIATKFIEYYWRQARPFGGDASLGVLLQNAGKQAKVVRELGAMQPDYAMSLMALRRDIPAWQSLVSSVRRVVCDMPLWKLQNLGNDDRQEFLYPHPKREGRVKAIQLQDGVAECFREFYGLVSNMIRGAWLRKVQSIDANRPLLGEDSQLMSFLFGNERADLSVYVPILHQHQSGKCFYCEKRITARPEVDHFVPWSKNPYDLGHNFVLAHASCNNSKRDYLAHTVHLAHWVESNILNAKDLEAALNIANVYHDANASQNITRWAYECGERAEVLMWRYGYEPQYFDRAWREVMQIDEPKFRYEFPEAGLSVKIDPELLEAYKNTRFCVFTASGELEMLVGTRNSAVDKLLDKHHVSSAAFITAWNPASQVLSADENAQRHQQLLAEVQSASYSWLDGEGRDPTGEWQAEQSLLVLGIDKATATQLAAKYGQNAYVLLVVGRPIELVLPA